MRAVGIIAEYNPFHNGHLYHLKESMARTGADASIAVMSGDFVQRGEPACADKWTRAEAAVRCGVDLVLELPFVYAVNSAEYFAKGAVRLLSGLGCVSHLSFGSEEGDLSRLSAAAAILADESAEFRQALKAALKQGVSYPRARADALALFLSPQRDTEFLRQPNNILAVEYLKQLLRTGSDIEPVTVERRGASYDAEELPDKGAMFASAAAIRNAIHKNVEISTIEGFLPAESADVYKTIYRNVHIKLNDFYPMIAYRILTSSTEELARVPAAGEGLEHRLTEKLRTVQDAESLVRAVAAKRYPASRIRRMLVQLLAGLTREEFLRMDSGGAMYGRVLAFSPRGAALLRELKKSEDCRIPLITNPNREALVREEDRMLLSFDVRAADLYNLACGENLYRASDFVRTPYRAETPARNC